MCTWEVVVAIFQVEIFYCGNKLFDFTLKELIAASCVLWKQLWD